MDQQPQVPKLTKMEFSGHIFTSAKFKRNITEADMLYSAGLFFSFNFQNFLLFAIILSSVWKNLTVVAKGIQATEKSDQGSNKTTVFEYLFNIL
jgi:hypothetical protein